jgi:addiction module HigA family antidote
MEEVMMVKARAIQSNQDWDPIHPGEVLREEFLKPLKLTAYRLASDIDVPPSRISDIIRGKRPITADTALRLGLFFDTTPQLWLNLQTDYDIRKVSQCHQAEIAPRIRVLRQVV